MINHFQNIKLDYIIKYDKIATFLNLNTIRIVHIVETKAQYNFEGVGLWQQFLLIPKKI